MATQSEGYEPGVYVKGDVARVANTRSEAVALVFNGYKAQPEAEVPEESAGFDPGSTDIKGVDNYLSAPEVSETEARRVLEAEKAGKNRKTVIQAIEAVIEPVPNPNDQS